MRGIGTWWIEGLGDSDVVSMCRQVPEDDEGVSLWWLVRNDVIPCSSESADRRLSDLRMW